MSDEDVVVLSSEATSDTVKPDNICVPMISRILRPPQIRENNGS